MTTSANFDIKAMNIVVNPSNLNEEDRAYAKRTANVIYRQLIGGGANMDVLASWAFQNPSFCFVYTTEGQRAALAFDVDGLLHTGKVFIVYNAGTDLYDVRYVDETGSVIQDTTEGLYFDQLTSSIDAHVERDPMWTDDEYQSRCIEAMGCLPEGLLHIIAG